MKQASGSFAQVETAVNNAERAAADLAHYFGEDPRTVQPGKVFNVLIEFANGFNASVAVLKRKRAAEARAKK